MAGCGARVPEAWGLDIDRVHAPALVARLAGSQVRVDDLLRDGRDRDLPIAGVPLLLAMMSVAPVFLRLMGPVYLVLALALNGVFLWQAFDIWRRPENPIIWRLYKFSLLYLALLFLAAGLDHLFYTAPAYIADISLALPF